MSQYIFAYGFLKRKFHGNQQTKTPDFDSVFVSEGLYQGLLYQVDSYPGVIYTGKAYHTKGEILKLANPGYALTILDRFENALPLVSISPDYERRLRSIKAKQGMIECWVYEYIKPIDPDTLITSGEFV